MKPIAESQHWRQQLSDIFLVAILLSAGVGLVTSSLSEFLKNWVALSGAVGILLVSLGLLLILRIQRQKQSEPLRLHGAIAFLVEDDEIKPVHIYDYEFNDGFCRNLDAFLSENAAFRKRFLAHFSGNDDSLHRTEAASFPFFKDTLVSVAEFILLDELDLHLNAYFVDHEIDTTTIKKIGREDLPQKVLENKVIDTFTRHYSDREAFIDNHFDESIGELCYATGKDGAVYNRLSVELPPNSSIDRAENGALRIKNKDFELTMLVEFDGSATYVHQDLMVVDCKELFSPYQLKVKLSSKASPPVFRSRETDKVYEWLDSYIERVERLVSIRFLEERLNPEFRRFMRASSSR